ncbi:hypothetical protein TWF730_007069 [Orbilia blumenaviensis]|uniref:Uncharacterized protein n=1 Tax=Orbilia blumenaviensis TaxID=1796055 RepID=A0AAV9VGH5_9PEZI
MANYRWLLLSLLLGAVEQKQPWIASCRVLSDTELRPVSSRLGPPYIESRCPNCSNNAIHESDSGNLSPYRGRAIPEYIGANVHAKRNEIDYEIDYDEDEDMTGVCDYNEDHNEEYDDDYFFGDDESVPSYDQGDADGDIAMDDFDHDDPVWSAEQDHSLGETPYDPWYQRAVGDGQINQEKEDDIGNSLLPRPRKDPEIDILGRFRYKIERTVNKEKNSFFNVVDLKEFWRLIDRLQVINKRTYWTVEGSKEGDEGDLTAIISPFDGHIILKDYEAAINTGPSWEMLADCWLQVLEREEAYGPLITLKYVSVANVTRAETLYQLVAAREKWFANGERGRVSRELILEAATVPFYDDASREAWLALRGTAEINAVLTMVNTYPNLFHGKILSVINLRFDKIEEPSRVDVFLEFRPPENSKNWQAVIGPEGGMDQEFDVSEALDGYGGSNEHEYEGSESGYKELDPHEESEPEVVLESEYEESDGYEESDPGYGGFGADEDIDVDPVYDPNVIVLETSAGSTLNSHPFLYDIVRTTSQVKTGSSYYTEEFQYGAAAESTTIYRISCSRREHELVFLGFGNPEYDTPAGIDRATLALSEIIYAAWLRQGGSSIPLRAITLDMLRKSENSLLAAFNRIKSQPFGNIYSFASSDAGFSKVMPTFLQSFEGKAIKIFIQKYGESLGNLYMHKIEFGNYITREGSFVYLTLKDDKSYQYSRSLEREKLLDIFKTGLNQYVKLALEDNDYRKRLQTLPRRTFMQTPKYPSVKELLGNFKIENTIAGSEKPLIYTSPAQNHLTKFGEYIDYKIFPGFMWERQIRGNPAQKGDIHGLITGVKYPGFRIGPAKPTGLIDTSKGYTVAVNLELKHIVVINVPQGKREAEPPLEDILFASWVKKYGRFVESDLSLFRRKDLGRTRHIRYVSFLELFPQTASLLRRIYRWGGLRFNEQACFSTVRPHEIFVSKTCRRKFRKIIETQKVGESQKVTTRNAPKVGDQRFTNAGYKLAWFLLLATAEGQAATGLFLKYTFPASFRVGIRHICIRWTEEEGEQRPELLFLADHRVGRMIKEFQNSPRHNLDIPQTITDPELRDQFVEGFKTIVSLRMLGIIKMLEPWRGEALIGAAEYDTSPIGEGLALPSDIVSAARQLRRSNIPRMTRVNSTGDGTNATLAPYDFRDWGPVYKNRGVYLGFNVKKWTENIVYEVLVSGTSVRAVIFRTSPRAGLSLGEFIKRLAQIIGKIWSIPTKIKREEGLRHVYYFKLQPKSEQEIFDIWTDLHGNNPAPNHVFLLAKPRYGFFWRDELSGAFENQRFDLALETRFYGLPETRATYLAMELYPRLLVSQSVQDIVVIGTRGQLRLLIVIRTAPEPKTLQSKKQKGRSKIEDLDNDGWGVPG